MSLIVYRIDRPLLYHYAQNILQKIPPEIRYNIRQKIRQKKEIAVDRRCCFSGLSLLHYAQADPQTGQKGLSDPLFRPPGPA